MVNQETEAQGGGVLSWVHTVSDKTGTQTQVSSTLSSGLLGLRQWYGPFLWAHSLGHQCEAL